MTVQRDYPYFNLSYKLNFCIVYYNIAWSDVPQYFSKMIRISIQEEASLVDTCLHNTHPGVLCIHCNLHPS